MAEGWSIGRFLSDQSDPTTPQVINILFAKNGNQNLIFFRFKHLHTQRNRVSWLFACSCKEKQLRKEFHVQTPDGLVLHSSGIKNGVFPVNSFFIHLQGLNPYRLMYLIMYL
jgi:hypothetical protein